MLTGLDHLILGIDDLDRGIAWVEQRTGVRAVFGGVHPGRGTRNALLALGPDCYLEIIAPDPEQSSPNWFSQVLTLHEPRLIGWAVHTPHLNTLAQTAAAAGFPIDGPHDGARARPDGKILSWKFLRLRDDRGGLLPFFIEWGRDSVHPAADAPQGCISSAFTCNRRMHRNWRAPATLWTLRCGSIRGKNRSCSPAFASPRGEVELTS